MTIMADQELAATQKQELSPNEGEFTREGVYFTPAVDIYETPQELFLLVDMPGVKTDSVDIDLKENVLSIVGKVAAPDTGSEELLTEYRTGNYFRSFRITDVIDQSKIAAAMADGVLTVTLPKASKAVPRRIAITGS
jgi:HSP20 family protein